MEWKECKIGDIGKIVTGKTPRTSIKENYGGTIPFLSPSDDMSYKSSPVTARTLTELGLKEVKNCLVPTDSICVSCIGSDLGKVVKASTPLVTNQQINTIIPFNSVDSDFIYYLMTIVGKELNFLSKTSTAVPIVNKSTFSNYDIRIPKNKKDQHRIASILSSLDRKIELNNKINAQLEEMAQALFKSWFVDFEPFKDGKFVESELGMIPEGWRVGSVYEYVKVIYGAPYKSNLFNDKAEGMPLIRIRDLKDCSPQFYTIEKLPNTEYVERGDIVAGMDAEFTPYIWRGNKGLLNQRVCKLKPVDEEISNLFALYLFLPHLNFVQSYKTGTTVSHLGKGDIDKFVSVLPPKQLVIEMSKKLDSILNRIKNLSAESLHLSQLRDTLLPKLMNGEIEL